MGWRKSSASLRTYPYGNGFEELPSISITDAPVAELKAALQTCARFAKQIVAQGTAGGRPVRGQTRAVAPYKLIRWSRRCAVDQRGLLVPNDLLLFLDKRVNTVCQGIKTLSTPGRVRWGQFRQAALVLQAQKEKPK